LPNASVLTSYGPPQVLEWKEVPIPEPGDGHIRIRVQAAGVGPTDAKIRRGDLADVFPLPPDAVLGFEAAGVVDALGPGATGVAVGDEVAALLPTLGGYAEYAVASSWTPKPESVGWAEAAALPASAEAAVGTLKELGVTSGESLLILGAAGSVGLIATQLAVAAGLTVYAAAPPLPTTTTCFASSEPFPFATARAWPPTFARTRCRSTPFSTLLGRAV
jgi:NADPH:quinone reductase-like Zn-dependent oxidoreductase